MRAVKKILAPTDFSLVSVAGLRYALELARELPATVIVYHAVTLGELSDYGSTSPAADFLDRYRSALDRFLETHCSDLLPSVTVERRVELGAPDAGIVEAARRENVGLIVMSTHGATGLSRFLVGSVTEKVVRQAPCPVLSIRPETAGKRPAEEAVPSPS
jgi:nucleotide-binding universal stress UspA family protein